PRDARAVAALLRHRVAHVPARDELHAIWIRVHRENDAVAEDPQRLGIVAANQLIYGLDQLVRAEHFGCVQAAVDPDDRLALLREPAWLVLRHAFGDAELARDLLVAIELLEVLWSGDDRHQLRPSFSRLADVDDPHPVGFFVELLPVGDELGIGGELVIVADVESEKLLRAGDVRSLRGRRHRDRRDQRQRYRDRAVSTYEHGTSPVGRPHSN